jgi:exopolyphosphatase/guanosine-5'-triphosphate,3'-diphosphate pyrophosphatase
MTQLGGELRPKRRRRPPTGGQLYAAVDLGTNNCRLLLAEAAVGGGFRVVGSFSKIIRLGEGLSQTGRLSEPAIARALDALRACAAKVAPFPGLKLRCIATQACRVAANGATFLAEVKRQTGLSFEIVDPEEEARLSVIGCAELFDPAASRALVVDIGGGSTELSWVEPRAGEARSLAWSSYPLGVVTLAERHLEPPGPLEDWYRHLCAEVAVEIGGFAEGFGLDAAFAEGSAHIVGTSGAVSSLAGVHLELRTYRRSLVDGLWMHVAEIEAAARELRALTRQARAAHPCIGPDRADLVLPGAAILETVCRMWPVARVRVADRGLREGVLLDLLEKDRRR